MDELKKLHIKMTIASNMVLRDLMNGSMKSRESIKDLEIEMDNIQESIRQKVDRPTLRSRDVDSNLRSKVPLAASLTKI